MSAGGTLDGLKERMAQAKDRPALVRGERVQKNLSMLPADAQRLQRLAERDGLSQARLITAALDAYEATYGKLQPGRS